MDILNKVTTQHIVRRFDWMASAFNLGESPCDFCEQERRCKQERLACHRFLHYVEYGELVVTTDYDEQIPSRGLYVKVFVNKNVHHLDENDIVEIKRLNNLRGMNHKMIAEQFYILPEMVRKIVGAV